MKRILVTSLIIVVSIAAILILIPVFQDLFAIRGHKDWSDKEKAYQWLVAGQRTNRKFLVFHTGLLPSQEKWEDCFVYDQALAAMAFTYHGDHEKARAIFRFFDKVRKRHTQEMGEIWGFTDAYKRDGRETETRAAGPNAWVLMALNYYIYKTEDKEFLPLAKDIADWLISLQSIEGGIIGGYYGSGAPMVWISSEHNFDCYAALRDLGIISGDEKYLKAAKEIKKWLADDVWNKKAQRFFLGRRNPNFATDLSSWAVLSLGKGYAPSLDFAIEKSLNTQIYKVKDVEVNGFDFGATYKMSPFPDKDAVWFEGTAHMVLAFEEAGREKEKAYFMNELDKCLTESPVFPFTKGLPYASNEGTPVYDSWLMQDKPLCVSSTAWYFFAKNSFNPFLALDNLEIANRVVENLNYEPEYQFTPIVDDFEYTDIKFQTSYPQDLIFLKKADISLEWTNELAVDGKHCMSIEFTPTKGAKKAAAIIKRPFLYPQDWSAYNLLHVWVHSNGTSGTTSYIANLSVKDREGETYNSPPIFLNINGWQQYSFNIWEDFTRDPYDGVNYGDNMFGLSGIIEIAIAIRGNRPVEDLKIYLDKIELEQSATIE
jgi:hypothetical protein